MFNKKRGQAGIEYVMIVGAILLITIPLFFYAVYEAGHKVKLNQADDAVHTLANAADVVYSMGPGSKKYVWIAIPSGVITSSVNENEVMLVLSIFGKESDVYAVSKAILVGSIPSDQGTYRIAVEALDAGVVRIGENYTDNTPPVILRVYPDPEPGQTVCPGFVTLAADTDEPALCKYTVVGAGTGYGDMEYFFDGRGLTHVSTLYLEPLLTYIYYARCQNSFGITMNTSTTISFDTNIPCGAEGTGNLTLNLSDEIIPPVVHLIAPPDGFERDFSWVDFAYTVSDVNSSIDYCLLVAYGLNYQGEQRTYFNWDSNPEKDVAQNLTVIMEKGTYEWYVNCTDGSTNHNVGRSAETWDIEVTRTFYESFLNSCAGQCGYAGFPNGGECRQNIGKCDDLGSCYGQDPGSPIGEDCYAGDEISEEYCTAGEQSPSCCCLPN